MTSGFQLVSSPSGFKAMSRASEQEEITEISFAELPLDLADREVNGLSPWPSSSEHTVLLNFSRTSL